MRTKLIAFSLFFCIVTLSSMEITLAQKEVSADILNLLNTEIDNLSGLTSDSYTDPDNTAITTWETIVDKISTENFIDIGGLVESVGYELLKVTDNSTDQARTYYLLRRSSTGTNYWGTYAFNFATTCDTKFVIQAPHPLADRNTGNEGAFAFKETGAFAFFLSGTHRCNNNTASTCSGTTSVCNDNSQAYRISDMAHNTDSPFQKATEVLANNLEETVFIQLHGFTKRDSDPYVIMSNGTKETPSGTDFAKELRDNLSGTDAFLSFQLGHVNTSWTRLLGTTNTQGRFINESANPCNDAATSSTGRFIHVEQEFSKLREDEGGWVTMTRGLAETFGCTVNFITDLNRYDLESSFRVYPNPFDRLLHVEGSFPANSKLVILDMVGRATFETHINSGEVIDMNIISSPGVYYAKIEGSNSNFESIKILKK